MRLNVIGAALVVAPILASTSALAQTAAPPPGTPTPSTSPSLPSSPGVGMPTSNGATVSPSSTPIEPTRQVSVDDLSEMEIVTSDGQEIGNVEEVVENTSDKKQFVVLRHGGVLGFGGTEVAVPLEAIAVQNDKIVLRNTTMAQVESMPEFDDDETNFRELEDEQQVTIVTQR